MFSETVHPPLACLLGRKKSIGIQVEFGEMLQITWEDRCGRKGFLKTCDKLNFWQFLWHTIAGLRLLNSRGLGDPLVTQERAFSCSVTTSLLVRVPVTQLHYFRSTIAILGRR